MPETSFPPALLEDGREPLAANLSGDKDSFRLGTTQLAASMLGVGLDQLIQRDAKRRRNRFRLLTTASMVFAAIMGGMAWTAMDARDAAEVSRSEAENMVEYLITDLKKELDTVGRLSILDDVGIRVTDYYDAIPLSDMDDERLTRQARARHVLGEVAIKQGRLDHALTELTASYAATEEFLRRNPNNPEAIFAHAQSEYWVGKVYLQNSPKKALPSRIAYRELSRQLYEIDPDNRDYLFEYGWAENNLGFLYRQVRKYDLANKHYKSSIAIFQGELDKTPNDDELIYEIAAIKKNLAALEYKLGKIDKSLANFTASEKKLSSLSKRHKNNQLYKDELLRVQIWLQDINIVQKKQCDIEKINEINSHLERLLLYDPSNQFWSKNYIFFNHIIFKNCQNQLSENWINSKLPDVMKTAKSIKVKNDKMTNQITWLKHFQTKKFSSEP